MGFDSNGNWTSDFYPETDRDEGIKILASKFQKLIQTDIKSGFDNCLTRDGAGKPQANLNFNGHKITNLANGELATDAMTLGQSQTGTTNYAEDSSITANEITIYVSPSISEYTVGQRFYFKVANTNTASEVSFSANGLDVCRVQMDGADNLVVGALKQNCIYVGVYYETGSTSESTYAGRRIQILSQASDLSNTLNNKQVTNCILSAPNGVATQLGLVVTLAKDVRFLMYHGLNADKTIDNIDYTTSASATYTFAGTETDGVYYMFVDDEGVITPSTSFARQTDKAIFAELEIESGAIANFKSYGALEVFKAQEAVNVILSSVSLDYTSSVAVTGNSFTAPADGYVFGGIGQPYGDVFWGITLGTSFYQLGISSDGKSSSIYVKIAKGETLTFSTNSWVGTVTFAPVKGA